MEQLFQSWWATSGAPFTEVSLESRIRKRNWRMILGGPGAPGSLFAPDGPLKQQFFKVDIRLSLLAINVFFSGSLWCSLVMLSSMNIFFLNCRY